MADIPQTTGQPDRGAGAYQFTGYTIYDPLVAWEMDVADRPGKLIPGLATEWSVDPADQKKWRFKLRNGVKFHDGSEFNADAVVWNLDKVLDEKAAHFDKRQSAQVRTRLPSVASWKKLDDMTVEITTKEMTRSSRIRCSGSWSPARRNTRSSARTGTSSPPRRPAPVRSSSTSSCRASAPNS